MRKAILTLALVLCTLTGARASMPLLGTYTSDGNVREIRTTDNKDHNLFISVAGEYKSDQVFLIIEEKDIPAFREALSLTREKYHEWKTVALTNRVTDFRKDYDIKFPPYKIGWNGANWNFTMSLRGFRMTFKTSSSGDPFSFAADKAHKWDNEYIDKKWYFILDTEEAFDEVLAAISQENIDRALSGSTDTDSLFK